MPPAPEPAPQSSSWLDVLWNLPVFRWLTGFDVPVAPVPPAPAEVAADQPQLPPCSVEPLPPIADSEALEFESKADSGGPVIDLDGLTPRASRALSRFENLVEARGGSLRLTSAFRPPAYQQHLRDVWYKWMDELRDNDDPSCAGLKSEVRQEFTRHQLLPTQHPVAVSDHTLGIGFDAAVELPRPSGRRRKRVTLDGVAHLAGMMRPDIRRDPVHFRLIGGRG